MNNKLLNDKIHKKKHKFSVLYLFQKKFRLIDFRSDLESDPLFPEVDPQIRIHIKMKWIRNTDHLEYYAPKS